ncbi:MAG TPA: PCRF domain-containing protein, partial [Paracoccus sp.]|nr:PCRF domain-containing protein [Paracoccus sp. (in: a-proteobacteria)]
MRAETQATVESIRKSLGLLAQRMDWNTAPHRLEEMNAMIEDGDLWSDPARAQKLMRDRQMLSDKVETYRRLDQDLRDSVELIELGEEEDDAEIVAEAEATLKSLAEIAAQKEL